MKTNFSYLAPQILILNVMENHLTLYVMNKYKQTLDILDSLDYELIEGASRSKAHRYAPEMVSVTIFLIFVVYTNSN